MKWPRQFITREDCTTIMIKKKTNYETLPRR